MKVYTRLVFDADGKVLEQESYEYSGPISETKGGGGGTVVNVPGPSEEEKALQKQQTEILAKQLDILEQTFAEQKLISPILYEKMGLKPTLDASGNITGYTPIVDPLDERRKELETAFLDRSSAALKGELPINPALLDELSKGEATLRETLLKNLGPGYETSSPGIEALTKFFGQKEALLDASRRDDITLAESLGLARQQTNDDAISKFLSRATGINRFASDFQNQFGQVAQGYNAPLSFFQKERDRQTQAAIANAQLSSKGRTGGLFGSLFGGIGTGIGSAAGTAIGGAIFSSKELKHNKRSIEPEVVLNALQDIPVELWEYVFKAGTHIGPYAEDLRERLGVGDGKVIQFQDAIGILFAAVKALDAKVKRLEHGRA